MAQTENSISARSQKVEYKIAAGSWTDVGGFLSIVTPGGGDRAQSEAHTFDGDIPVIGWGKRAAATAEVTVLYTETDAEPFDALYDAKVAHSITQIRWQPAGAGGTVQFLISGYISVCTPPTGDAGSADKQLFTCTVVGAEIVKGTAA